MTRAQWYSRKYGGTWRTARVSHRCQCVPLGGLQCTNRIMPGDQYFDTRANRGASPLFCATCANQEVPK